MIEGLRPYPEMRDSGVAWLGQVPAHWGTARNGNLFAVRKEKGYPELPVLEISIQAGVNVRDKDNGRKQHIEDRSEYQRAVHNDLAYNTMRAWQGSIGIARDRRFAIVIDGAHSSESGKAAA